MFNNAKHLSQRMLLFLMFKNSYSALQQTLILGVMVAPCFCILYTLPNELITPSMPATTVHVLKAMGLRAAGHRDMPTQSHLREPTWARLQAPVEVVTCISCGVLAH